MRRAAVLAGIVIACGGCRSTRPGAPSSERAPAAVQAQVARAERHLNDGEPEQALALLDEAVAAAPGYFPALRARQEARIARDGEAAVLAAARAGAAKRRDAARLTLLARVEQDEAARHALEEAVALDPEFHWAWYGQGVLAARGGRAEEAEERFTQALALYPRFAPALVLRAQVRDQLADFEGAAADYETYLRLESGDTRALYNHASILHRELHRPDRAEELYRVLLDLDGDMTEAAVGLAVCLAERGEYAAAERLYRSVADREPSALFNLGMLYQEHLGRPAAARDCFERFLRYMPPAGGTAPSIADRLIYAPVRLRELDQGSDGVRAGADR